MEHPAEVPVGISANWRFALLTPSLGWCGDIPKGPGWRFRTSAGHSAKATTLGDGVHQWGHLIADNSSQNHPGRLFRSCPSTVINTGFFPHSITECSREVVTGPSLMEEIADLLLNPMFEMPGDSSTCNSPYSMAKKEGTPLIWERYSRVTWSNHLPPLMGLHRQIQPISWPIPAAPSHMVLQRGTSAVLLSHHQPTPSTCWTMYCASKRKWMMQWLIYCPPGLQ